jgi:CheY-like chemotaxis protein
MKFLEEFLIETDVPERIKDMGTCALSVLIIDDDPDILTSVRLCLRSTDWTVTTTLDGAEGIRLAEELQPDVIVCDAIMPGLSGEEVIELLKSKPETERIPIVLMTAFPIPEAFADTHWTNFLAKPFGPTELFTVIESAARWRIR